MSFGPTEPQHIGLGWCPTCHAPEWVRSWIYTNPRTVDDDFKDIVYHAPDDRCQRCEGRTAKEISEARSYFYLQRHPVQRRALTCLLVPVCITLSMPVYLWYGLTAFWDRGPMAFWDNVADTLLYARRQW